MHLSLLPVSQNSYDSLPAHYLKRNSSAVYKFCGQHFKFESDMRKLEMHIKNKNRSATEFFLNEAWFNAPEHPSVRTPEFFVVCNLCDGGYAK